MEDDLRADIKIIAHSTAQLENAMSKMSDTMSELVTLDTKTFKNEKDIQVLFSLTRDIEKSIATKSDAHFIKCEERADEVTGLIRADIKWYLAGVFSLIAVVFYSGISTADDVSTIKDIVIENRTNIKHNTALATKYMDNTIVLDKSARKDYNAVNSK